MEHEYWYNFKVGQYDDRTTTPNVYEMADYLPQMHTVQNLYQLYVQSGEDHLAAAIMVLELYIRIDE